MISTDSAISIRRELAPGDLGAIIEMHGRVYAREYGNDERFEAMVAGSVARAAQRGFPSQREGIWIVERDGAREFLGSLAFTDEGDGSAALRWVLLDSSLRGEGLGRRLIGEAIAEARAHGYSRIILDTFSLLRSAGHLYRSFGFEVVSTDTAPRWGHDSIDYQRYELELAVEPQSTTTTAPPRRGSPPPSSRPSASRATA